MHYEIVPAVSAVRKNMTHAQKHSSLFREAPVVGGKTIRRGQRMVVKPTDMERLKLDIIHGLMSGSLFVRELDEDGRLVSLASGWDLKNKCPTFERQGSESTLVPSLPKEPAIGVPQDPEKPPEDLPPEELPPAEIPPVAPPPPEEVQEQVESDKVEVPATPDSALDAAASDKKSKKGRNKE